MEIETLLNYVMLKDENLYNKLMESENIPNYLLSSVINLAFPLNDIKLDFCHHIPCIVEHISKLYYWKQDDYSKNSWYDSLHKGFEILPKKLNNKYPTYDDLKLIINEDFDYIFEQNYSKILRMLNSSKYEKEPRFKENKERIKELSKNYFEWVLKTITSQKTGITVDEVKKWCENNIK